MAKKISPVDDDDDFVKAAKAAGWSPPFVSYSAEDIADMCPIFSGSYSDQKKIDHTGPESLSVDSKYPFPDMDVNDYFVVHVDIDDQAIRQAAARYATATGSKFSFRRGRCWRIR